MAVYLFWGQEEYLMEKEIKKLKNGLLDASFAAMGYKTFDNPQFGVLLEALQSAPLMFGNTLSVINIDKYLTGTGISLDDKQLAAIDYALKNLSGSVNIIFVCKIARDENKKPDSRKKLYKIISKYSDVREFAQYRNYDKTLPAVIISMAKDKDLTVSAAAASYIIEQLGVNLTLINSELEKLKIAVYPEKTAKPEDVKKYCTSSDDIFILADLIIQGDKNKILKQYNLLSEKRHFLEISAFLQSSLQKFIFIKSCEKKLSAKDISLKLKMHEFIVQKTQEKLRRVSLKRLIQIKENLLHAEYMIKSGRAALEDTVLEAAILS